MKFVQTKVLDKSIKKQQIQKQVNSNLANRDLCLSPTRIKGKQLQNILTRNQTKKKIKKNRRNKNKNGANSQDNDSDYQAQSMEIEQSNEVSNYNGSNIEEENSRPQDDQTPILSVSSQIIKYYTILDYYQSLNTWLFKYSKDPILTALDQEKNQRNQNGTNKKIIPEPPNNLILPPQKSKGQGQNLQSSAKQSQKITYQILASNQNNQFEIFSKGLKNQQKVQIQDQLKQSKGYQNGIYLVQDLTENDVNPLVQTLKKQVFLKKELQQSLPYIQERIKKRLLQQNYNPDQIHPCTVCWKLYTSGHQLGGHMSKKHPGKSLQYKFKDNVKAINSPQDQRNKYFQKIISKKVYFDIERKQNRRLKNANSDQSDDSSDPSDMSSEEEF